MSDPVFATISGANALMTNLEIISNNLANANTVGFKRDSMVFESMLSKDEDVNQDSFEKLFILDPPLNDNVYSSAVNKYTDYSQGPLKKTEVLTDCALAGRGFFKVQVEDKTAYTREGSFVVNSQGVLTTRGGNPIMGRGGEIAITDPNFSVTTKGEIVQNGKITEMFDVVDFQGNYPLEKIGHNLFQAASDDVRTVPADQTEVLQGQLEGSNVNVVKDLTALMAVSRLYEAYNRNIQNMSKINTRAAVEIAKV